MADGERTYIVPLRKGFQKAPRYKRAKRAVSEVRQFLSRHLKGESVKIGKFLNEKLWERGIKNPPHKIKINAIKDDEGIIRAELYGKPIDIPSIEDEKSEAKLEKALDKAKEAVGAKTTKKPAKKKAAAKKETAEEKEAKPAKKAEKPAAKPAAKTPTKKAPAKPAEKKSPAKKK